jgi:hypothetical protein
MPRYSNFKLIVVPVARSSRVYDTGCLFQQALLLLLVLRRIQLVLLFRTLVQVIGLG